MKANSKVNSMKEPVQFSADIQLACEQGVIDDDHHAVRLTMIGLPTEAMAERMADWLYDLVEKNLKQAMVACAPEGAELVAMKKHSEASGTEH